MSKSNFAGEKLRSFIECIERLHAERAELAQDVSGVFQEAKGEGFDVKIMRECIRLRRMKQHDRVEHDELLALYMGQLESGTDVALTRAHAREEGA